MTNRATWLLCDSRQDAITREPNAVSEITTSDPDTWGLLYVGDLAFRVGFTDVGLVPEVHHDATGTLIGIGELLVAFDVSGKNQLFLYKMPTIFHEFLTVNERGLLVRDETGFILLSRNGEEIWSYCPDLLGSFELADGIIRGETIEGAPFSVRVPQA